VLFVVAHRLFDGLVERCSLLLVLWALKGGVGIKAGTEESSDRGDVLSQLGAADHLADIGHGEGVGIKQAQATILQGTEGVDDLHICEGYGWVLLCKIEAEVVHPLDDALELLLHLWKRRQRLALFRKRDLHFHEDYRR